MIKPFFITGLPRSRTAWMANWLTTDRTFCLHDPEPGTVLEQLAGKDGYLRVGAAGPELVRDYELIHQAYPSAPWLVLMRPATEALSAFRATMRRNGDLGRCSEDQLQEFWGERVHQLALLTRHPHVLVFSMRDLDEEQCARAMWRHLLPEIPFQLDRWTLLKDLNVQQQLHSYASAT